MNTTGCDVDTAAQAAVGLDPRVGEHDVVLAIASAVHLLHANPLQDMYVLEQEREHVQQRDLSFQADVVTVD